MNNLDFYYYIFNSPDITMYGINKRRIIYTKYDNLYYIYNGNNANKAILIGLCSVENVGRY